MTPKQQVIAALRSGEFKQGLGALKRDDCHCCLGVATVLYSRTVRKLATRIGDHSDHPFVEFQGEVPDKDGVTDWHGACLPHPVREWLGCNGSGSLRLDDDIASYVPSLKGGFETTLVNLNDVYQLTFEQIALVLEHSRFTTHFTETA